MASVIAVAIDVVRSDRASSSAIRLFMTASVVIPAAQDQETVALNGVASEPPDAGATSAHGAA